MPRDRWRATLDGGTKLDLAKLIRRGAGKLGTNIRCTLTYGSGETITADIKLRGVWRVDGAVPRRRAADILSGFIATAFWRAAMVRCLSENQATVPCFLSTSRGDLLRQPSCLGPQRCVCLPVP